MIYLSLRSLLNVVQNAFSSVDTLAVHVLLYFLYSKPHRRRKKREKKINAKSNNNNQYKRKWSNQKGLTAYSWKFSAIVLLWYSPMAPCSYHNFSLCLCFLSLNLHLADYNRIELKYDYQRWNCTCSMTM